jgi:hypothetical protein
MRGADLLTVVQGISGLTTGPVHTLVTTYANAVSGAIALWQGATNWQGAGSVLDNFISKHHGEMTGIFNALRSRCPRVSADILVPPAAGFYENMGRDRDAPPITGPTEPADTTG